MPGVPVEGHGDQAARIEVVRVVDAVDHNGVRRPGGKLKRVVLLGAVDDRSVPGQLKEVGHADIHARLGALNLDEVLGTGDRVLVVEPQLAQFLRRQLDESALVVELVQGQIDLGIGVDVGQGDGEEPLAGGHDPVPQLSQGGLLAGQVPEVDLPQIGWRGEDGRHTVDVGQLRLVKLRNQGLLAVGRVYLVNLSCRAEAINRGGGAMGEAVEIVLHLLTDHFERVLLGRDPQQAAGIPVGRGQVEVSVAVERQITRRPVVIQIQHPLGPGGVGIDLEEVGHAQLVPAGRKQLAGIVELQGVDVDSLPYPHADGGDVLGDDGGGRTLEIDV